MYNKEIIEALNNKNWDELIVLANKAKYSTVKETMFGIKKGYINVFKGYAARKLEPELLQVGIKIFRYGSQGRLINDIKLGLITKELVDNEYVVFLLDRGSAANILFKYGFTTNIFELTSKKVGVKSTAYKKIIRDHFYDNKTGGYKEKDVNRTFYGEEYLEFQLKDLQNKDTFKFKEKTFAGLFRENRIDSIFQDINKNTRVANSGVNTARASKRRSATINGPRR